MPKRRKRTNKDIPAKGRLRDMADKLWSLAVRADWANKCAACGRGKTEAHHLIPRQHTALRHVVQNGIALCATHHQFDPNMAPHQNADGFVLWMETHCPALRAWLRERNEDGSHTEFNGTTNEWYYIGVIQDLRQYVDDDDYVRIVGKKFAAYLEKDNEPPTHTEAF